VLQKAGVRAHFEEGKTIDSGTFSRARVAKVGKSAMYKQPWGKGERLVEVIGKLKTLVRWGEANEAAGVEVPHFG